MARAARPDMARFGSLFAISARSRSTAAVTVRLGGPPVGEGWSDWLILAPSSGFVSGCGSVATGVLWSAVLRLVSVNVSEVEATRDGLLERLAALEAPTTRLAFGRDEGATAGAGDFAAVNLWFPSVALVLVFDAITESRCSATRVTQ